MKITFSNDIKIENPIEEISDYAERNLILPNPEYYKKEQMGFWTGNTEKELYLFARDGDILILPFGCNSDIWKILKNTPNLEYSFMTDFAPEQKINLREKEDSKLILYDYQKRALESLLRGKNGVLEGSCGCGKTQIGLALIQRLGLRALWLTHTQKLLLQSKERCEKYFFGDFGTVTEGKINLGKDITFATVQTMANIDPKIYQNAFDVVVVDECHHVCGTPTQIHQFYKVITNCKARFKFGMSATLSRSDGLIKSLFSCVGNKLHTITKEEIGEKIIKAKHVEFPIEHPYKIEEYCDNDGVLSYPKLIEAICNCKARNYQIAENVIRQRMNGRRQLILTSRVEHAYELARLIPRSSVCVGKIKERDRDYLSDTIIATYALAKEGLDIPSLDTLHLATPQKDRATVVQSVGRIERNIEGKKEPICFDYVDEKIYYCRKAFAKRKNILKKT